MNETAINENADRLRDDFSRDGYVSIPDFVAGDELATLIENKYRLLRDVVPQMPASAVFYEDRGDASTLKQLLHLYEHDDYFHRMMFGSRFEQLASVLLGEAVIGKNMQYFNKPPRDRQGNAPASGRLLLQAQAQPRGDDVACARRGERGTGLRPVRRGVASARDAAPCQVGVLGFSQHILDFPQPNDLDHEVAFPCRAGHLIVHHSLTIHWAQNNQTADRTREAMGFIYYGQSAREDEAAHRAYQAQLEAELATEGKI